MQSSIGKETIRAAPNAFCSWSGGKDSCLALHRAAGGIKPVCLVTMMIEDGSRSRSHGLRREVIRAQADAMGMSLSMRSVTWDGYEAAFTEQLHELRKAGVTTGVFGDIDLQPHRDWVERVCAGAGIEPTLPLWDEDRLATVSECLELGMDIRLASGRSDVMPKQFAGRRLDMDVARELERMGIDACGENGEFHTVVLDAPMFERPLVLTSGELHEQDGHWSLDFTVEGA